MAVRLLFFLLVFANLIFFAWTQGYFGAVDDGREPLRLDQQLNPQRLRLVRQGERPPAPPPAPACRSVAGLAASEAEALKAALEAAGGEVRLTPVTGSPVYLVVIADLAGKAAADRKAAELARLGVRDHALVALEGGRHEIVLGRFDEEAAAGTFLQGIARRGVKSARIEGREPPPRARVEARGPEALLLQELPKLIAPFADAALGECAG